MQVIKQLNNCNIHLNSMKTNCSVCPSIIEQSSTESSEVAAYLDDGDAHDADVVVGQQLDFDGGGAHKGERDGANVGRHGCQPQLDPQLALQIQVAYQHRDLQHQVLRDLCRYRSTLWAVRRGPHEVL